MRGPVAGAIVVGVVLATVLRGFVWPRHARPFGDGPVVVLGGGGGERLTRALQLRAGGDTTLPRGDRELVLSAEAIEDHRRRGGRCDDPGVSCIIPVPSNTFGEALAVGRLVEERGWSHVTVVTSDFHVTRTRLLLRRFVDVPVAVVPVPTQPPLRELLWRVGRESIATVVAVVRSRRR